MSVAFAIGIRMRLRITMRVVVVVVVVVVLLLMVVVTSDDDDDDDSVGAAFRPVVATIIGDASERPAHGLDCCRG